MLVASVAVLLVIPLLLGILFEFVVVIPLRVPLDQTALLYIWQVSFSGIFLFKISVYSMGTSKADLVMKINMRNKNIIFITK